MSKYTAKSDGVSLIEHSLNVAEISYNLVDEICGNYDRKEEIKEAAYFCGLFHDCGKANKYFQQYLLSDGDRPFDHPYVSTFYIKNHIKLPIEISEHQDVIMCSILNHHPIISDNSMVSDDIFDNDTFEFFNELNEKSRFKFNIVKEPLYDDCESLPDVYSFLGKPSNDKFILFLNCVLRYSDILDSNRKLNNDSFTKISKFNDIKISKPSDYDDRFFEQEFKAKECFSNQFSLFDAKTGYGKTMLGVLYLLQNNKKGYWICPRNTITRGVYDTITKEIVKLGLSDKVSVALMITGKYEDCNDGNIERYENGLELPDIIVTNIDSFLRPIIKTDSNIRNFSIINSNVIFDEFHEYNSDDAILAGYEMIVKSRTFCENSKTLFLSATPCDELLPSSTVKYSGKSERIENRKYNIVFADEYSNESLIGENHLFFINTVKSCQIIKTLCLTDNIIHARYTDEDKNLIYKRLLDTHSKTSSNTNNSWVGNGVIGTGLDINFNGMTIGYFTPDLLLQVIGRCNRWDNCEEIPTIKLFCYDNKINKSETSIITQTYNLTLMKEFFNYLKTFGNGIYSLSKLYEIRKQFISEHSTEYKKIYKTNQIESNKKLSKLTYAYSNKSNNDADNLVLSNKNGWRSCDSDKIFVLIKNSNEMGEPIQIDLNANFEITNDYLINNYNEIINVYKLTDNKEFICKNYFDGNKYKMQNTFKKKPTEVLSILKKMAMNSKTPLLLDNSFGYTKELGLFKK